MIHATKELPRLLNHPGIYFLTYIQTMEGQTEGGSKSRNLLFHTLAGTDPKLQYGYDSFSASGNALSYLDFRTAYSEADMPKDGSGKQVIAYATRVWWWMCESIAKSSYL